MKNYCMLSILMIVMQLRADFSTTIDYARVGFQYTFGDTENNRRCRSNMVKGFAASTLILATEKTCNEHGLIPEAKLGFLVCPSLFFLTTLTLPENKTWTQKASYFAGAIIPFLYSFLTKDRIGSPPRYLTPSPPSDDII